LSLTFRDKHRLRAFENKELRRIFGARRDKGQEGGESCISRSVMICKLPKV
jgi:hypothetical protein